MYGLKSYVLVNDHLQDHVKPSKATEIQLRQKVQQLLLCRRGPSSSIQSRPLRPLLTRQLCNAKPDVCASQAEGETLHTRSTASGGMRLLKTLLQGWAVILGNLNSV